MAKYRLGQEKRGVVFRKTQKRRKEGLKENIYFTSLLHGFWQMYFYFW